MQKVSLDGVWQLSTANGNYQNIPAQLPGDNYSALINAGLCPDPYWADNEQIIQHFRLENWIFEREFTLPEKFLDHASVSLDLSMVDTFCEISLNGNKVVSCSNLYAAYNPEVKRFLRPGKNHIRLTFVSIDEAVKKIAEKRGEKFRQCGYCKIPDLNQVRKPICSGGWDWGIFLSANGVYAPITLSAFNNLVIRNIRTEQKHSPDLAEVTAIAEIYAEKPATECVSFEFNNESKSVSLSLQPGMNLVQTTFTVSSPRLWWPNGAGKSELYQLNVAADGDKLCRQIGLRTIETVHQPDEYGTSLFFRVNGKDIFAKGANWIPCDALPGRMSDERYENLLESARLANMNMIRVWGGGFYEKDIFYELCDKKGLMVWQDMMFSVSEYPSDDEFLAEVDSELEYQIRRLRHHASLAIWCGDNECSGCFPRTPEQKEQWLIQYKRLNDFLASKAAALDPERVFWPSSPCGGPGSTTDNWHEDRHGDMHYWEVWHGGKEFSAYYSIKPRFCSEFGYQSFPSLDTVKLFCPDDQLEIHSPAISWHQKHRLGNQPIIDMFAKYFRQPEGLENFLYLSQVQQALAIKTGVEFWRTLKPRCMGTIFWQFNDNWPVASWSSIEYGGKWKLLNYEAKRFYAPVISAVYKDENNHYPLYITSDLIQECQAMLTVEKRHISGELLEKRTDTHHLAPGQSLQIIKDCQHKFAIDPQEHFLEIYLEVTTPDGGRFHHRNSAFFAPFKDMILPETKIKTEIIRRCNEFVITLSASGTALFTALDLPGYKGIFSDNNFTLLPGKMREIIFFPAEEYSAEQMAKDIKIYHLKTTYNK